MTKTECSRVFIPLFFHNFTSGASLLPAFFHWCLRKCSKRPPKRSVTNKFVLLKMASTAHSAPGGRLCESEVNKG